MAHPKGLTAGWAASYQWLRNGQEIRGKAAKRATYKLRRRDRGKSLSVRVTYTVPGFASWQVITLGTKRIR